MSLTLSGQPGFTELADSTFDAGNALTASNMKSLNADAKFAAVRNEQFWGYYKDGETVVLPVSPADGYIYSNAELVFTWSVYWSGSATGALNGTQTTPSRGATGGGGTLLQSGYLVDQTTGVVACNASYFSGAQHDTNDGILLVMTHAQRSR
jgi:hypothetical protein